MELRRIRVAIRAALATTLALTTHPPAGGAEEPTSRPAEFGTAHPGLVEAVDPAGRWAVVCQARADTDGDGKIETSIGYHGDPYGDELVPYLVVHGGAGTPIGRLLAVDPTNRYVVGAPEGRVTLYDTRTGTAIELAPKPAPDGRPAPIDPWASFDATGRRCLTVRVRGEGEPAVARLVVRDLERGTEVSVDPGPGLLVAASLSGDGAWIHAAVVVEDTDRSGGLEPRRVRGTLYRGGCAGHVSSYSTFGWSGDDAVKRVLAVDGSVRRDVPGLLALVGRRWLWRAADGALGLGGPTGESRTVADATSKARVVATDAATETVLFASSVGPDPAPVFAAGPAGVRELGIRLDVEAQRGDRVSHVPARVSPIGRWDGGAAMDWSRGVAVRLQGKWLACDGARVLVLRERTLVVVDVDAGTATALPGATDHDVYERAWRAGPLAAAGGFVVDLPNAKVVGTYPYPLEVPYPTSVAAAWGLRDDGAVLRSAAPSADRRVLPSGPFRWEYPTAPK